MKSPDNVTYECTGCGAVFDRYESLLDHMITDHRYDLVADFARS